MTPPEPAQEGDPLEDALSRAILDALPAHVAVIDPAGDIVAVNEAWRRFAESNSLASRSFGIGSNYLEICAGARGEDSDGAQAVHDGILGVLSGRSRAFTVDYPFHTGGVRRWFRMLVSPLRIANRHLTIVMHVNITEQMVAEKALGASFRELSDLKAALDEHAIVAITDPAGRITYANERFCRISGYGREELVGRTHRVVNSGFHPPDFFKDLWSTISAGRVWRGEIRNRTKNGENYWVDTTIVPVMGEDGVPNQFVSIRTDITRIKDVEEALQLRLHELQRWKDVTLGREERIQALKREVNEALRSAGKAPRYLETPPAPSTSREIPPPGP